MNNILCRCGRPTAGAVLCERCRHTASVAIANVAAYHDDLETVRARQTRYGTQAGPRSSEKPLGMDARFGPGGSGTRALQIARMTVRNWSNRILADQPGLEPPAHDTLRSACNFLQANLRTIVTRHDADLFLRGILAAEKDLARLVDRPPESWYAGVCGARLAAHDGTSCACSCHDTCNLEGCDLEHGCDIPGGCGVEYDNTECTRVLYATPGDPFVRCGDCGTTYDVATRREQLLAEAEDHLATVEMITRVVTTLGDTQVRASKISERIRLWAHRGRITSHGTRVIDGRPRPVYRIGDVLDLLANLEEKSG